MKKNSRRSSVRWVVTRLFIFFTTLVVMVIGTVFFGQFGLKISQTQFKMIDIHLSIKDYESNRDSNSEKAQKCSGQAARAYQNIADSYDSEISVLEQQRDALQASDDPVIAWAAKDQADLGTLFIGVGIYFILCILWFAWYCFVSNIVLVGQKRPKGMV